MADTLRVTEVHVVPGGDSDGDGGARAQRFVLCRNPEAADRDTAVRERRVEHLAGLIADSDIWSNTRRDELVGSLKTKPGLRRYLRRTATGRLRIDHAAIKRGALGRQAAPPHLRSHPDPEDLAATYKQLIAVERGGRDRKGALGLRPMFHPARTASAPTSNCASSRYY